MPGSWGADLIVYADRVSAAVDRGKTLAALLQATPSARHAHLTLIQGGGAASSADGF